MPVASVLRTADEQWRADVGASLDAAFHLCRSALPRMRSWFHQAPRATSRLPW
ncbi:hypothetical protein ABT294_44035 [Nonomuraea sp. NPDC000554]|uniref:hypothetical protein n=1 Tax=Nonomuraea sp. NPDC000554 TaxID=3154259 RepID=UPI003323DCB5